jgi:predicted SPOUT superfamily RNA methylase MTH1
MIVGLEFVILGEARILEVVPKSEPREKGHYWGYTVRHASSLSTAISESTYPVCLRFKAFLQLNDIPLNSDMLRSFTLFIQNYSTRQT